MTQLCTEVVSMVDGIKGQDVAELLRYVAILHQIGNAFLEQIEHQSQKRLLPSKNVVELSHRVRDALSVILSSAWILEVHADNLDASQLSKHYSIIRTKIVCLLSELEVASQWQELDFELPQIPVVFENFVK